MKYFFCLAALYISLTSGRAQAVESIPVQFGQFFNAYSIINPASCGSKANAELELGKQQHGGVWRNISTTYISGSVRIRSPKRLNSFHVLGLSFANDKEGEYLKRSKFYLTYGWHTKLTEQLSLSAGASLGLYSYLVSGSNASVSGGANAPDASVGLWLYSDVYYLGGSINQIFNSELTPLEETTRLLRHYNITGGYLFSVSESFSLAPKTLIRYAPGYLTDVDFVMVGIVQEIMAVGINYRHNRGIVPGLGLEKLSIGQGRLSAMFSYAFPVGKVASQIQTYELTLNFDFKSDKKRL